MSLRDLVEGMNGEDVRALQQGLNAYFGDSREALDPDGKFGTKTQAAFDAFQSTTREPAISTARLTVSPGNAPGESFSARRLYSECSGIPAMAAPSDSDNPMYRPGSTRGGCTLARPSRVGNHSSSGSRPSLGLTYSRSTGPRSCKTRRSITPPSVSSTFPCRWSLRRS